MCHESGSENFLQRQEDEADIMSRRLFSNGLLAARGIVRTQFQRSKVRTPQLTLLLLPVRVTHPSVLSVRSSHNYTMNENPINVWEYFFTLAVQGCSCTY